MFDWFWTPAELLPEGVGFKLYGIEHLTWLFVLTLMIIGMIRLYVNLDATKRRTMCRIIAYTLLVLEFSRDIYIALMGGWRWEYLPFHPCSFSLYFMAIWAYKPNKICGNLLYGYGIVGALCALLFCNWTNQPIWHFQTIYSFLVHGLIIGYTLMAIIGKDIIPESKGIIYNLIFVVIAVPFTAILNNTLPDCNFFFTHAGSEGSPLEFLINTMGVPWWLIGYFGLCALVLAIEFIPLYVIEKRKNA